MRNSSINLAGYKNCCPIKIQRFDMSLIVYGNNKNKKWYLFFNPPEDLVTIHYTMPEWYEKLAILAEAVAYDMVTRPEISILREKYSSNRIIAERLCLAKVKPPHRKQWLKARSVYYSFRIEQVHNEKDLKSFVDAKQLIDGIIAQENGSTVEYLKSDYEYFETRYRITSFEDKVPDPRRKWLVYFTNDGQVYLDETSPNWYRKLASIAEEIGMANKYPELLGDKEVSKLDLCRKAEEVVIDKFTSKKTRNKFIGARIELFELLLETGLNRNDDIKLTLNYLRQLRNET